MTHLLNIEEIVITDQIKWIIKNLFIKKTANSDNISNEILKMICEKMKENLIMTITQCFTDNLLSSLKKVHNSDTAQERKEKLLTFWQLSLNHTRKYNCQVT